MLKNWQCLCTNIVIYCNLFIFLNEKNIFLLINYGTFCTSLYTFPGDMVCVILILYNQNVLVFCENKYRNYNICLSD
jgi:hypothetical protein